MHRPLARCNAVDVEGVDADQCGSGLGEQFSAALGEVRMALEVFFCSPMPVPSGVEQECSAADPVRRQVAGNPL